MGSPALTNPSKLQPIGDLSLAQRSDIRGNVDQQLTDLFLSSGVVNSDNEIVLRDMLPYTDMGLTGGTNGETWLITAAGTAGTAISYINAKQLTTTQCAAFYGVASYMATPNISRVSFLLGSGSATTRFVVQLEPLFSRLEVAGYLATPMSYKPNQYITVSVMPFRSFAANSEYLTLLGRMADQIGQTISGPSV